MSDKLYFLNSFYCRGRWGRDQNNKSVRLQEDFIQINEKDCETNETKLIYYENPKINFYVTKDKNKYKYQRMSMPISELDVIQCKYSEREKEMAKSVNKLNQFYDECRKGRVFDYNTNTMIDHKRIFVQNCLYNSPNIYLGDFDIEDYYKNTHMDKYGRDVFQKYGVIKQGMMDIEVDQYFNNWSIDDKSAPINSISYSDMVTNTLYLLVLNNQPDNKDVEYVKNNFEKFISEFVTPHAHDNTINYKVDFYDTEKGLILGFWDLIHKLKPDFVGIWNMNFDIPYILSRMKTLEIDELSTCCHPDVPEQYRYVRYIEDSERNKDNRFITTDNTHPSRLWDWVQISGYTQFYDMMALYSLIRKRYIFPSYKLDDISETVTGHGKLDYHSMGYTIKKLAHQNFKIFLSYSIIDTVRLQQIENITGDLKRMIIFADNTKLQTSVKISYVIKNKMYRIYLDSNPSKIVGNNVTYDIKEKIDGAIIASPDKLRVKGKGILNDTNGLVYDDVVDFDEASEYPRIILTFNASKNTVYGRLRSITLNGKELLVNDNFNKQLQTLQTSIFDIGKEYYGLPDIDEMIEMIENGYDKMK